MSFRRFLFVFRFLLISFLSNAQQASSILKEGWQWRQAGTNNWLSATVPGSIHTDLLAHNIIPDPFFSTNESTLRWIDTVGWEYRNEFLIDAVNFSRKKIDLVFDGLDTYADVYLNDRLLLKADNMFRQWKVNIKPHLNRNNNKLLIRFHPAKKVTDSLAVQALPLYLPDNNRVYARKAQYQFGWDWGPTFISCGVWKKVWIDAYDEQSGADSIQEVKDKLYAKKNNNIKLVQQPDKDGISFFFEKDGKPIYAKGANWIPADAFPARPTRDDYRKLLQMARDANMNMLRVWGGGIYEDDAFYDLCDEMGIMVWQDLMFAGGMYPGDENFFSNVKEEIKYQVKRLRHHPCIVLWCGNNEIDEAWHNWGWQKQYNLHGKDSIKIWHDYTKLFKDSLPQWIAEVDPGKPYIPSSPLHGWGHKESFREGDSHYWGLWWGLEDWEQFHTKTGRFVSEYGMQAMPGREQIESFTNPSERQLQSAAIISHQKANQGFQKLNHYLQRYFIDSARLQRLSLYEYSYISQCLQYYVLSNSIAVHRSKEPFNMGTLLWQLNDCWPVCSWSILNYDKKPKAGWYAVKEAYRDDIKPFADPVAPKQRVLNKPSFTYKIIDDHSFEMQSDVDAEFVFVNAGKGNEYFSDNYFSLKAGKPKRLSIGKHQIKTTWLKKIRAMSLYDVLKSEKADLP